VQGIQARQGEEALNSIEVAAKGAGSRSSSGLERGESVGVELGTGVSTGEQSVSAPGERVEVDKEGLDVDVEESTALLGSGNEVRESRS